MDLLSTFAKAAVDVPPFAKAAADMPVRRLNVTQNLSFSLSRWFFNGLLDPRHFSDTLTQLCDQSAEDIVELPLHGL